MMMIFIEVMKCLRWTVSEIWAYLWLQYANIFGPKKTESKISVDQIFIFFRKHSWSLKTHFNAKMSEIRPKKVLVFFFGQTPTHFRPKNGTLRANLRAYRYCYIVIGIIGNLNPEIQEVLLNSFDPLKYPFKRIYQKMGQGALKSFGYMCIFTLG